ncbi:Carbonic anhydrase [Naviculisporaceae sp. PSN 640]
MFRTRLIGSFLSTTTKQVSSSAIATIPPFPSRIGTASSWSVRYCSNHGSLGRAAATTPVFKPASTPLTQSTTRSASSSQQGQQDQDISMYLKETHERVFTRNRSWAAEQIAKDPDFFKKISAGQNPEYLWIGCSDSRIPAEQITGLQPGEAFVHRNIANLVCNTDLNAMSVIEYAVAHLQVKHIVVCGHYGCGGVKAAMTPKDLGILNPWLRNIRDVYRLHEKELDAIEDKDAQCDRLVELNVMEQCRNIIKTATLQKSYAQNKFPVVHGWVFDFRTGHLKDLNIDFEARLQDIQKIYNLVDN